MPIRGANPACYPVLVQKRVQNGDGLTKTLRFCATWPFFAPLRRDGCGGGVGIHQRPRPAELERRGGLHDLPALHLSC